MVIKEKGFKLAFWINISRDTFYLYLLLYSKENYSFKIIHNFVISSCSFPFFPYFSLSVFFSFFVFSYLCVYRLFSSLLLGLCLQAWRNPLTVLPCSISFQNVYGRFGEKPNKKLIQEYEQLALGNCDALKLSRMLKVTVSRYSTTLHLIFQGFFKPQSNFSSSSINLNKKKAVVWHLKDALMLAAMIPLSMKRNLKNTCRD